MISANFCSIIVYMVGIGKLIECVCEFCRVCLTMIDKGEISRQPFFIELLQFEKCILSNDKCIVLRINKIRVKCLGNMLDFYQRT